MPKRKATITRSGKRRAAGIPIRNVVPDRLDLRDRMYMPSVGVVPGVTLRPKHPVPVLDQGQTNACTGFALASVVCLLQHNAKREQKDCRVSPFMLYSMARRYDEFPGDPGVDTGSSLRGAMKGWYKHGACLDSLWTTETMPIDQLTKSSDDWWLDAVRRPLGAYYRVDTRSVTDMHVALNEIGILYASAVCHSGWDKGFSKPSHRKGGYWLIPRGKGGPGDGGHAFAIVGYNQDGFIIHNSWGVGWGTKGYAVLSYEDWLDNAMDCWVAQLGVVTELHLTIAHSPTLRLEAGKVQLASESSLRTREINPFIIDMANNGRLSNTGDFRTQESDITALVTDHLGMARTAWGLGKNDPMDVAIYAHGGLTSEDDAGETAAKWIPALYEHKIFPIFLMWETDLWSTLTGRLADVLAGQPRTTGGLVDRVKDWWNERLEKLLAVPGTAIWSEMKQNADAISNTAESGGMQLYRACRKSPYFEDLSKVRLHLVGHSAGSILHSHVVQRLGRQGWTFESVNFMAPAVRVDLFQETVLPAIKTGKVKRFNQFHLSDDMEQKDPTCKPILGYSRSLLYLVSQSLEQGRTTPILGLEKYFNDTIGSKQLLNVFAWTAPGKESKSTTHGGFDDDQVTMKSVIALIKGEAL
ncbi:MAG TPA: C1 family peptidase [Nitrospiraceae bacterium]|nr:C1 family peptidase [Nitrospiraceae bacterium]